MTPDFAYLCFLVVQTTMAAFGTVKLVLHLVKRRGSIDGTIQTTLVGGVAFTVCVSVYTACSLVHEVARWIAQT